jgi:hypothetical protein
MIIMQHYSLVLELNLNVKAEPLSAAIVGREESNTSIPVCTNAHNASGLQHPGRTRIFSSGRIFCKNHKKFSKRKEGLFHNEILTTVSLISGIIASKSAASPRSRDTSRPSIRNPSTG